MKFLFDWQTLIAGLLAIAAAALGGLFVLNQTRRADRQDQAQLARQHAAARAVLSLALNSVMDYAGGVATALERFREERASLPTLAFDPPEPLDSSVIGPLRDMIEFGSPITNDISDLIADLQVLFARLRALVESTGPHGTTLVVEANVLDYCMDAVVVYARAGALFDYARRRRGDAPPTALTQTEVQQGLFLLNLDINPDLVSRAAAWSPRWTEES